MPASNIDLYHMQDARNNFDAMRPAPVCADANQYMGQCQNIHISTNCYYGYHDPKPAENEGTMTDCEMMETEVSHSNTAASSQINSRKRSADDGEQPHKKRFREEVQTMKNIKPETNEIKKLDQDTEDLWEALYWNTHGGRIFQLLQCS
ncbi:unnamed protein product [Diatraea saccharalis]|uniref:Uncharacterized protein n=1 Tax=Diatraea saccharalis TaxID=40085 RepID=A0A9P0C9Z6_9NEOP|nr:unnamed protein product [Diatraea saccharalis]